MTDGRNKERSILFLRPIIRFAEWLGIRHHFTQYAAYLHTFRHKFLMFIDRKIFALQRSIQPVLALCLLSISLCTPQPHCQGSVQAKASIPFRSTRFRSLIAAGPGLFPPDSQPATDVLLTFR